MPTLLIPLAMWGGAELMTHFSEKLAREKATILVLNHQVAPELTEQLRQQANPIGVAKRLVELLNAKGLGIKEMSLSQSNPEAFWRILEDRGIDRQDLIDEVIGVVADGDFDPTPGNIVARAFPPNFELITDTDPQINQAKIVAAIKQEEIAAAIEYAPDTKTLIASGKSAAIKVYYLASSDRSSMAKSGLKKIFHRLGKQIVATRLEERGLSQDFISPIKVRTKRLPGPSELVKFLSQILPYLLLIFAFMGALYPAIDLCAGEKERGTLETLLVAPVNRLSIVVGKFLVILVAALTSAFLSTLSLTVSMQLGIFSTLALVSGGSFSFGATEALTALVLVIPIGCIFAALLMAISIFAKSFKEAQSYATPLNMLIIFPAFASMIPGVKLDWVTASIPLVNVSLALKEVFTGNLAQHWAHLGMIFLSTSIYAALLLWFSAWWFQREEVLFRN
jgi:sodium transport system permease protein